MCALAFRSHLHQATVCNNPAYYNPVSCYLSTYCPSKAYPASNPRLFSNLYHFYHCLSWQFLSYRLLAPILPYPSLPPSLLPPQLLPLPLQRQKARFNATAAASGIVSSIGSFPRIGLAARCGLTLWWAVHFYVAASQHAGYFGAGAMVA